MKSNCLFFLTAIFLISCNPKVELKLNLEKDFTTTTTYDIIVKGRTEHSQYKIYVDHVVESVLPNNSYQVSSVISRIIYKTKSDNIYFDSNKPEDLELQHPLLHEQKSLLNRKFTYELTSYGEIVNPEQGMKQTYSILPFEFSPKPIRMGSKWYHSKDPLKNSRKNWFSVNAKNEKTVKIEASQSASMNAAMSLLGGEQATGFYYLDPETNLVKEGELRLKHEVFGDMVIYIK